MSEILPMMMVLEADNLALFLIKNEMTIENNSQVIERSNLDSLKDNLLKEETPAIVMVK
jgi:hypothetical protein